MRIVTLVVVLLLSVSLFAEQTGFAKGDQPATASYSPTPALSFNSAGGAINIKRLGVGLYSVTFVGIAKNMKRSNVQLSDVGSGSEQCSLRAWMRGTGTDNLVINIHCISNTTGANVDGRWSVYAKIIE
jgi:hypothetical protein